MANANLTTKRPGMAASLNSGRINLADSAQVAGYIQTLLDARAADTRQGNLEVVTGTVAFTTLAGGVVPVGTARTFFQDQIGQAAASGLVQTPADGNLWGGACPSGVALVLYGLGFSVECDTAYTTEDVTAIGRNFALEVNLRGNTVLAGSVRDWPDVIGTRQIGLGNATGGVVPLDPPIVILPMQQLVVRIILVRPLALSNALTEYRLHLRCPSTRIYDPIALGKS